MNEYESEHSKTIGEVTYDYTYLPGEKEVRYYGDGSGQPASHPSIVIEAIFVDGVDVFDPLYDFLDLGRIESLLLDNHD